MKEIQNISIKLCQSFVDNVIVNSSVYFQALILPVRIYYYFSLSTVALSLLITTIGLFMVESWNHMSANIIENLTVLLASKCKYDFMFNFISIISPQTPTAGHRPVLMIATSPIACESIAIISTLGKRIGDRKASRVSAGDCVARHQPGDIWINFVQVVISTLDGYIGRQSLVFKLAGCTADEVDIWDTKILCLDIVISKTPPQALGHVTVMCNLFFFKI